MKFEVTFSLVVNVSVLKKNQKKEKKEKTGFLVSEYDCYCTTTGFASGTRFLLFYFWLTIQSNLNVYFVIFQSLTFASC